MFPCQNESARRRKCRKNTTGDNKGGRGGHAAADQVPVFWSLNFKLDSHVYTYKAHHMRNELGLASDLPGLKYCVNRGRGLSVVYCTRRRERFFI